MPELYGLIGKKLTHSFSKKYFTEKFEKEGLEGKSYQLFELESIEELPKVIESHPDLKGLNVTIPYKEAVFPYLDEIDPAAREIGAVNVIKVDDKGLHGFNSDFYGFRESLVRWLPNKQLKALVLGTGGASKAVTAALNDLSIPYLLVSRKSTPGTTLDYHELEGNPDIISQHHLIINTTPLGMYPHLESKPDIPYPLITPDHYLYDLVYNPEKTSFMQNGEAQGASIKNGLEMLHLQAERSWELWGG